MPLNASYCRSHNLKLISIGDCLRISPFFPLLLIRAEIFSRGVSRDLSRCLAVRELFSATADTSTLTCVND